MKKLMFLSLAVTLVFTACKKNRDEAEPAHKNILVKRTDSDGLIFTYTYDANNRMSGYASSSNPWNAARNFTFTYNSNGTLAEAFESNGNIKVKYMYNIDGTVAGKKQYSVSGAVETLNDTYTYTYVAGVTTERYVSAATGNGFRQEYKYDANGNEVEEKVYSNTTPADPVGTFSGTIVKANYDTKISPGSCYPAAFLFPGSAKNNPGTLTYTPGGTGTYTYEYNADGYPTKRTAGTEVSVYEYKRL